MAWLFYVYLLYDYIYLRIIPDQMHFIDIVRPIIIISQKKKEKRRKREGKVPKENHARVKIFQPTINLDLVGFRKTAFESTEESW